jgi:hypothetical protein
LGRGPRSYQSPNQNQPPKEEKLRSAMFQSQHKHFYLPGKREFTGRNPFAEPKTKTPLQYDPLTRAERVVRCKSSDSPSESQTNTLCVDDPRPFTNPSK